MNPHELEQYARLSPLYVEPGYVRSTRELIGQSGGVAHGIAEVLRRAGVTVTIDGDSSAWAHEGQGTLLVGDHRTATESVPVVAAFGRLGREDLHFIGKPFSLQARVIGSLGTAAANMLLPVWPGTLARDRDFRHIWNRDILWRVVRGGRLPTHQQLTALNARTVSQCASLAAKGQAVGLYPAGGVVDATRKPWHRGLGTIIRRLPAEARHTVQIVPFQVTNFSTSRLGRSLAMQNCGLRPPAWTVSLRIGRQGTIYELLGDVHDLGDTDIVDGLRQQYIASFGRPTASQA